MTVFDPTFHTAAYLIRNPDKAYDLASVKEFQDSIAQDPDFLIKVYAASSSYELNPVASLAEQKNWAISGAAQNKQVLALKTTQSGRSIGHELAYLDEWANTPAAQDLEVLTMAMKNNVTVAHTLAKRESWGATQSSQNPEVIAHLFRDLSGRAVAHVLARKNVTWWSTPAAHSKDILKLKSHGNGETVVYGNGETVAELAYGAEIHEDTKADTVLRLIKHGEALLFKNAPEMPVEVLTEIMARFEAQLELHTDESCRLVIVAALYSTLVHVSRFPELQNDCDHILSRIAVLESQLREIVESNDAARTSLLTRQDDGCDEARNFVIKLENGLVLDGIKTIGALETVETGNHSMPSLY